jgi:hypothetical protein
VSVQISPPTAPGQGGGPIGVCAPFARDPARRQGQPTARPFAALPHDLIADKRLKATDVRLAGILLRYARDKSTCWPSVATLGADLGRCRRTVQTSLRRLEAAGWISTRPAPNPTGREFVMVWREQADADARDRHRLAEQLPYSQGLPSAKGAQSPALGGRDAAPAVGAQSPAPESRPEREKREGSALARDQSNTPERPMTHAELLSWYGDVGWLKLPVSDPLRRIAERALERAVGSPSGGAENGSWNRGRSPGTGFPTGIVRGSRG